MCSASLTARARAAPPRGEEEAACPRGGELCPPGPWGRPCSRPGPPSAGTQSDSPLGFRRRASAQREEGRGEGSAPPLASSARFPPLSTRVSSCGSVGPAQAVCPSVCPSSAVQLLLGPGGLNPPGGAGRCRLAAARAWDPGSTRQA